jgi:hypothetical protein
MTDGFHGFKRPESHFSIAKKVGSQPFVQAARLTQDPEIHRRFARFSSLRQEAESAPHGSIHGPVLRNGNVFDVHFARSESGLALGQHMLALVGDDELGRVARPDAR